MFKIFFIQNILSFFANCLSKKCVNDNKGKLLFHFGQGKWIGKGVYHTKKIQLFLCPTPLVTEIIQFMDISFSKNNTEEFQRSEVPFPVGILVHVNELLEDDWIIQNGKNGKVKWCKNCVLKISASK